MTNVNKESVARSLTSFLGEVPKEIEEAGDISKSAVSGKDIAKIILGDHLLEDCKLERWHGSCEGCPFSHDNENDENWGRCELRHMVLVAPRMKS